MSNDGLWQDIVNDKGEHSLETHTPKLVKEWCSFEQHIFQPEIPKDRKIHCMVCGQEFIFVVGYHQLKDGHISIRQ